MSGDPRNPRDAATPDAATDGDPDPRAQLLTAYVDGVVELPPGERRDVEAWLADDPAARREAAAVQSVLGRLRALPPNAGDVAEPDWAAMERSIRHAVAGEPIRPWWRRWQWLVPAMTFATATAVLLVIWPRPGPVSLPTHRRVAEPVTSDSPAPADGVVALWLDGAEVDVDLAAPDPLPDPFGAVGLEPGGSPRSDAGDDGDDGDELGLLPTTDLVWVDRLDDAALDRAERWLAGSANPGPGRPTGRHPGTPSSPSRKKS